MDVYCLNCGEPWDIFCLQDEPEEFKLAEENTGRIVACPCCEGKPQDLSPQQSGRLESISAVAELLGDDVDGLAAMLDDLEYLGLLDEE